MRPKSGFWFFIRYTSSHRTVKTKQWYCHLLTRTCAKDCGKAGDYQKQHASILYDVLPNTNEQQYELSDTDNEEVTQTMKK